MDHSSSTKRSVDVSTDNDSGVDFVRRYQDVSQEWDVQLFKRIVLEEKKPALELRWDAAFLILCIIAVSLDPLFLYIPIIDKERKCLGMDRKLRTAVVVLRSVMDITFVSDIVIQIWCWTVPPEKRGGSLYELPSSWSLKRKRDAIFGLTLEKTIGEKMKMPWLSVSIIMDFLALLPIPQVAILAAYFRTSTGLGYLHKTGILNSFILFQYLPRLYLIYEMMAGWDLSMARAWVKSAFNFLLFLVISHVLGAFWYFFSIQRELTCWLEACKSTPGCTSSYYCEDTRTSSSINTTLLNALCPVNPSNATIFDFGIFIDVLESGNTGLINFSTKFFYCFWWGFRNLSNFGTDLQTSSYVWENCFAILTSAMGLLLVLYLIGNVQTYIQMAATNSEERKALISKLLVKVKKIRRWMDFNKISSDMQTQIIDDIKETLEVNVDVDVDLKGVMSLVSQNLENSLKKHLCLNMVTKVPFFGEMDDTGLSMDFYPNLRPVVFAENSLIFSEGEPISFMLLITRGILCTYASTPSDAAGGPSTSTSSRYFEKDDVLGVELIIFWGYLKKSFSELPIVAQNIKCITKVEALAFSALDIEEFWKTKTTAAYRAAQPASLLADLVGVDPSSPIV